MTSTINKKILMTVLIIGCFLSTLNQTILNVALSSLMEAFSVSASTIQWLATGFMLVNGILVPITAYLMKRFSTRQLFISSMVLLLIGTILCAVAPSFSVLLIGRMIQAAGAGIIMPLMMSIVMFVYPAESRGSAMGLIGLAMIFAPAIAPTLAGSVIEYFSWQWLFIGLIPFVVIVILFALKYLVDVSEAQSAKLDAASVMLSTISFGLILYGFSSAGSNGWGNAIVISSLIVGCVVLAIFCLRQLRSDEPLLNLKVFTNKTFTMTSIINILVTMLMYADMILLPMYLQDGRGFTALDAGLLLLPGALVNAFMSPITGKLYDRFGAKPLLMVGLLFVIPSMWVVTDLNETTSFMFLTVRTIFLRIGLSFLTMPLNTAGLNALPKALITHGTAVNNTVRQLAGSIGTAVVITIFTFQAAKHLTNLTGESLSAGIDQIQKLAAIYGSSDAYNFMTILGIIALVITLLSPTKKHESMKDSN